MQVYPAEHDLKPKNKTSQNNVLKGSRWSHLGSNQGPPDYESGALTS